VRGARLTPFEAEYSGRDGLHSAAAPPRPQRSPFRRPLPPSQAGPDRMFAHRNCRAGAGGLGVFRLVD